MIKLEVVYPLNALEASGVAHRCLTALSGPRSDKTTAEAAAHAIDRTVERAKAAGHFHVRVGRATLDWSVVAGHSLAFLHASGVPEDSLGLLLFSLWEMAPLVSARLYDAHYEYWQNATDPRQFQIADRSTEGLVFRSNGLPAPLTRSIVDTSANPGRRTLRRGYVEAISSRMAVGAAFFDRVPGATRNTIESATWLLLREPVNDGLMVTAHDGPFVDGGTARLQERLRSLLFPRSK